MVSLADFERQVLRWLGANRNPNSFVAGAAVLHQARELAAPEFAQITRTTAA